MELKARYVETIKVDGYNLPFISCSNNGLNWYEVGDNRVLNPEHYTISNTCNMEAYYSIDRYLSRQGL